MQSGPVLRPWLNGVRAYTPGKTALSDHGRLASNEAPHPLPTIRSENAEGLLGEINRYPDPTAQELRRAIADTHSVDPAEVVVGNGSDELIHLLIQAYAAFTGSIAVASPGYALYALCAQRLGAQTVTVELDGWTHDLDAMANVDTDIAFICNPANPTGTVVEPASLAHFIRTSRAKLVVIDEAYAEFNTAEALDTMSVAVTSPRTIVLRTFSKAHALAGARVGYFVAHKSIADTIRAIQLPFSVNSVAQHLATRSLQESDNALKNVASIVSIRHELQDLLDDLEIHYVPSEASFVLALTERSEELVAHLARHSIAVRPGADLGINNAARITVPAEYGFTGLEQALRIFSRKELVR